MFLLKFAREHCVYNLTNKLEPYLVFFTSRSSMSIVKVIIKIIV